MSKSKNWHDNNIIWDGPPNLRMVMAFDHRTHHLILPSIIIVAELLFLMDGEVMTVIVCVANGLARLYLVTSKYIDRLL